MDRQEIIKEFHGDLTLTEVRKKFNTRHNNITDVWVEEFGAEAFARRKSRKYRLSKLGDNNPMKGKMKELHPNWKGTNSISTSCGYERERTPEWYTGTPGAYTAKHILVYCESRGLTEIPRGFQVHHLDMNKKNNSPNNLVMLSTLDHRLLHAWVNRVIVQRLSAME